MKNKIIMMISAALLLTSLSAFAQVDSTSKVDSIVTIKLMDDATYEKLKANLAHAQEFAANPIERKVWHGFPYKAGGPSLEKPLFSNEEITSLCGDNQYCKWNIILLETSYATFKKGQIIDYIKRVKDYKQALYTNIQKDPWGIGLGNVEREQRKVLNSFKAIQEATSDFPTTQFELIDRIKKLIKYYNGTKEQKDFIKELITAIDVDAIKSCSKYLDNVNNYSLKSFCLLDWYNNSYPFPIKELKELK